MSINMSINMSSAMNTRCDFCHFDAGFSCKRRQGHPAYILCQHCYQFSLPKRLRETGIAVTKPFRRAYEPDEVDTNQSTTSENANNASGRSVKTSKVIRTRFHESKDENVHESKDEITRKTSESNEPGIIETVTETVTNLVEASGKGLLDGVKESFRDTFSSIGRRLSDKGGK